MDRRTFVGTGLSGALGVGLGQAVEWSEPIAGAQSVRSLFPRVEQETFLNGAGGTPLGAFAEEGIVRYVDFIRLGPADGRGTYRERVWSGVRGSFARLVGAKDAEIGLVECTKAGEQIVLDGLPALRRGGNVVTNDMHFSGSLHNLEGLRRSGLDVRVVRADEDFGVSVERMADAMDERTALVTVSLVSNVNGRIEPITELSRIAHDRGALVFADIIQAAGAIPVDVHAMGIDFAACSSYKWLFGIHGAGFFYVAEDLQGAALPDHLFPGHSRRAYGPWIEAGSPAAPDAFTFVAPSSAQRYQPGHVSYIGYAAVYEALRFLDDIGVPRIQAHSTGLVARLLDQVDTDAYRVLTPEPDRAPILSLRPPTVEGLVERLTRAKVTVSVGGDLERLMRISPAIYNTTEDVDRLAAVLHEHVRG